MPKLKKHSLYTSEKVSKMIKNIFLHLRKNITDFDIDANYYSAVFEDDLNKIEKHWMKKYSHKIEKLDEI